MFFNVRSQIYGIEEEYVFILYRKLPLARHETFSKLKYLTLTSLDINSHVSVCKIITFAPTDSRKREGKLERKFKQYISQAVMTTQRNALRMFQAQSLVLKETQF